MFPRADQSVRSSLLFKNKGMHAGRQHTKSQPWNLHCRLEAIWATDYNPASGFVTQPRRKPEPGTRDVMHRLNIAGGPL
ncbi:hypothetical protein TRAPUB_9097 [Trametes pubescens]|uniref:Uncharacterized protein n=1 Tax=Trametes pubescens TaxID=154538 RepID=A0A1M2W3G3_TRAPU|nr:hypothetical protein TRAPUB_9097 [Trametes pubescens]